MTSEFVIWGNAPGSDEQSLLLTLHKGKPITDIRQAIACKLWLRDCKGCSNLKIQEIELSQEGAEKLANAFRGTVQS